MLKAQKDESIHNMIYRTHVINGIFDFSNIITTKGSWSSFPKVLQDTLHLYKPIDDFKLLHLLRDIGLARITNKIFENPLEYREDLQKFLGQYNDKYGSKQGTTPIRYCLPCIKDYIKKFGYSFINVTWSRNSLCPTHETDLHIAEVTNRREAIDALNCIVRGVHPKAYKKPSYRSDYFHDFREYYHVKSCEYIAPCLDDELKEFIIANWKSFPRDLIDKNYSSESYLTQPYMMTKIYESAKNSKYKQFTHFWNNFAEIKYIDSGVINRKAITEKHIKAPKQIAKIVST